MAIDGLEGYQLGRDVVEGVVGADENVLYGALNCGQTKGDCGVNRAHSRRRYSGEGGREVILQLEGGNICYGCGNGSGGFVPSNSHGELRQNWVYLLAGGFTHRR